MADLSVNHPRHRGHRSDTVEYRIYFAIIYAFALPFAVVACAWTLLRHGRAPAAGPFARARAEAHQVAPMIFRG